MDDKVNIKKFLTKNYSKRVVSDILSRVKKIENEFKVNLTFVKKEADIYKILQLIEKKYFIKKP